MFFCFPFFLNVFLSPPPPPPPPPTTASRSRVERIALYFVKKELFWLQGGYRFEVFFWRELHCIPGLVEKEKFWLQGNIELKYDF
jgi:hypothetical protein